jgi:prevent-host-death family protein
MRTINMHEAKTNLSRLVEQAVSTGEPFVIAKAGRPMVTVTVHEDAVRHSSGPLGFLLGQGRVPDDFDDIGSAEIVRMFGGEAE